MLEAIRFCNHPIYLVSHDTSSTQLCVIALYDTPKAVIMWHGLVHCACLLSNEDGEGDKA
jgi:hypothetical protein